jgi:hypothetical protein
VIAKLAALALFFFALSFPAFSSVGCIPFDQAQKHIGETQCVRGKVLRVETGSGGVHYLDFCEDYGSCSFSVVVFASDLKRIGDVEQLAGKNIEIRGEVKEYDGRAEIVLENAKQLGGEATRLPPFPKMFDVEQQGHFSAGQSHASRKRARTKKPTPTLPIEVPEDAESD